MRITFLGATKTVTGSCYLIETVCCRFIVDCGLFQGRKTEVLRNYEPFKFLTSEIDFVILTHAHIDHSGRLPLLRKRGYNKNIYATKATAELCELLLPDSGHIQEMETEWKNRKRKRAGLEPIEPLYTFDEANRVLGQFVKCQYDTTIEINENVRIKFRDAGHILGSSIVEMWIKEDDRQTKIVFSGDIGNNDTAIIRNPSIIESADYVIMESTYGNRLHESESVRINKLVDAISSTRKNGGNVVIPSFAVGRTQEMIYYLNKHMNKFKDSYGEIMSMPVFVDSPLATSATEVFRNNLDVFDKEAREYIRNGDNPLDFDGLRFTKSVDESKMINQIDTPKIIISSSGMCDAGRIKHHLKHNLWRKDSTIVFVGYQAYGTLGRYILDGAKKVKIFGEEIYVNAKIIKIDGFSGHADKDGLFNWLKGFKNPPKKVFLVHGEEDVIEEFAKDIRTEFKYDVIIPAFAQTFFMDGFEFNKEREDESAIDVLEERERIENMYGTIMHEYKLMLASLDKKLDEEMTSEQRNKIYEKLTSLESSIVSLMD